MSFRRFKRFLDVEAAADTVAVLQAHAIAYELEEDLQPSDGVIVFGQSRPVFLQLLPADFVRARQLIRLQLAPAVAAAVSDHYLFAFTDEELQEIIAKPDEWSDFDYLLAQRLLRERGHDLSEREVAQQARSRHRTLAQPEAANQWVIQLGYVLALFGGLLGLLTGWYLHSHHIILPDGQRVPAYDEESRAHGRRILVIGSVVLLLAACRVLWKLLDV